MVELQHILCVKLNVILLGLENLSPNVFSTPISMTFQIVEICVGAAQLPVVVVVVIIIALLLSRVNMRLQTAFYGRLKPNTLRGRIMT